MSTTQDSPAAEDKAFPIQTLFLMAAGIVFNIVLGTVMHTFKAPIYFDAVGTIVVTLLCGWRAGALTGVGSFLVGGLLTNPVLPWFSATQCAIALYVWLVARQGWLVSYPKVLMSGIGLGLVAGIVSAPVIVYLFGGITGSGASLIVAFMLASGKSVINSVVLSGLAAEPLDKTLQLLLAIWLLKGVPQTILQKFNNPLLAKNRLVSADHG